MRFLLIRHGQTPSNVSGQLDTAHPGAPLTDLGRRQALALPQALRDERLEGVYASSLQRTQLTAGPLAEYLEQPVQVLDGVEEISAGNLEMLSDEASRTRYADCLVDWMHGQLDSSMPGGTSGHDFIDRYLQALQAVARTHKHQGSVAVFSHGAAIRVFTAWAARMDPADAARLKIENTGGARLQLNMRGRWRLQRWNTAPLGGLSVRTAAAHDVTSGVAQPQTAAR